MDDGTKEIAEAALQRFPFEPYPAQRELMAKTIAALRRRECAVLESPTGTGKTMALLCGCLQWQESERQRIKRGDIDTVALELRRQKSDPAQAAPPYAKRRTLYRGIIMGAEDARQTLNEHRKKVTVQDRARRHGKLIMGGYVTLSQIPPVFYCTRTHAQIRQVVRELGRSGYPTSMNILASRDKYCVNSAVTGGVANRRNNLGELCDKMVNRNMCTAWELFDDFRKQVQTVGPAVWDIEDLVQAGKSHGGCPYYAARDLVMSADIIMCPYSYLLDPLIRHECKMEGRLADCVVVLDEAHNIDEVCREAISFTLSTDKLRFMRGAEIRHWLPGTGSALHWPRGFKETMGETIADDFVLVDKAYEDLLSLAQHIRGNSIVVSGRDLHDALRCCAPAESKRFDRALENFMGLGVTFNPFDMLVNTIHHMKKILSLIRFLRMKPNAFYLRITRKPYVAWEDIDPCQWEAKGLEVPPPPTHVDMLEACCLDPSLAFAHLRQDVRAVVIASGTLSPLDALVTELGEGFPIRMQGDHVIDGPSQLCAVSVGRVGDVTMQLTHQALSQPVYLDAIGTAVATVCESVPGGVLCFVPNYSLLRRLLERWRQTGMLERIAGTKRVHVEPKGPQALARELVQYGKEAQSCGALFLGVFRGKLAEGIDFHDDWARAVICVGIPFASVTEEAVLQKRRYNDRRKAGAFGDPPAGCLSGEEWYTADAFRALNQAMGRVLRHRHDYGAVVLLDSRHESTGTAGRLPHWLRTELRHCGSIQNCTSALTTFFQARGSYNVRPPPSSSVPSRSAPRLCLRSSGKVATTRDTVFARVGTRGRTREKATEIESAEVDPVFADSLFETLPLDTPQRPLEAGEAVGPETVPARRDEGGRTSVESLDDTVMKCEEGRDNGEATIAAGESCSMREDVLQDDTAKVEAAKAEAAKAEA
eukprot:Hpha_TRINITY_DN9246_c0_g1::TRINITY_DN9246_c0_g1_i1::g.28750::m.28750/K15362/BRIP1, BACH1, FANCJ; fanconi anemia group J protein